MRKPIGKHILIKLFLLLVLVISNQLHANNDSLEFAKFVEYAKSKVLEVKEQNRLNTLSGNKQNNQYYISLSNVPQDISLDHLTIKRNNGASQITGTQAQQLNTRLQNLSSETGVESYMLVITYIPVYYYGNDFTQKTVKELLELKLENNSKTVDDEINSLCDALSSQLLDNQGQKVLLYHAHVFSPSTANKKGKRRGLFNISGNTNVDKQKLRSSVPGSFTALNPNSMYSISDDMIDVYEKTMYTYKAPNLNAQSAKNYLQDHLAKYKNPTFKPTIDSTLALIDANESMYKDYMLAYYLTEKFKGSAKFYNLLVYSAIDNGGDGIDAYRRYKKSLIDFIAWRTQFVQKAEQITCSASAGQTAEDHMNTLFFISAILSDGDMMNLSTNARKNIICALSNYDIDDHLNIDQDLLRTSAGKEKIVIRLFHNIPTPAARDDLYNFLYQNPDILNKFYDKIDDSFFFGLIGANNFKDFSVELVTFCNQSNEFKTKYNNLDIYSNENLSYYFYYRDIYERMFTSRPVGSYIYDVSWTNNNTQVKITGDVQETDDIVRTLSPRTLNPLDPVFFCNKSSLGMVATLPFKEAIVPAFFCEYTNKKAGDQTTSDVVDVVLTALGTVSGYSELRAGLTGWRKAYALFELANNCANIGMNVYNAVSSSPNPKMQQVLNYWNNITAVLGVTQLASNPSTIADAATAAKKSGVNLIQKTDLTGFINSVKSLQNELGNLSELELNQLLLYEQFLIQAKQEAKIQKELYGINNIESEIDEAIAICRNGCFSAHTPVYTLHGYKFIKDLVANQDSILAFDETSRMSVYTPIEATLKKSSNQLVYLYTDSDTILTTREHLFLTSTDWVPAGELKIGQSLLSLYNDLSASAVEYKTPLAYRTITKIETRDTSCFVYNLQIKKYHTYTVGSGQLVVHNNCNIARNNIISRLGSQAPTYTTLLNALSNELLVRLNSISNNTDLANILSDINSTTAMRQALNIQMIDAWLIVKPYSSFRKDLDVLQKTMDILSDGKFIDNDLAGIISANMALKTNATSLKDFLLDIRYFGNYNNCDGFNTIIGNLKNPNFGSADGANWIIEYIRQNGTLFTPNSTSFEVSIFGGSRRYDVITGTSSNSKFFEFKSWSSVPPSSFGQQIGYDLLNPNLNNLTQLEWIFEKAKLGNITQFTSAQRQSFINAVNSQLTTFTPTQKTKVLQVFQNYAASKNLPAFDDFSDVSTFISTNTTWFNDVFKLK